MASVDFAACHLFKSIEHRRGPDLREDVARLLRNRGVDVVAAKDLHQIELAETQVEDTVNGPPSLDRVKVRRGRLIGVALEGSDASLGRATLGGHGSPRTRCIWE